MIYSAILILALAVPPSTADGLLIYVSPDGNDAWSGTRASPAPDGADGPLATLHGCQNVIRARFSVGGRQAVTVYVRGGTYPLPQALRFTARDCGGPGDTVIWRSYPGERAVITGGTRLPHGAPVLDPDILDGLPAAAREQVLTLDLKRIGITDYGTVAQRGSPGMELFLGGVRMTPARWPNDGWSHVAEVPQRGDSMLHPGLDREKRYDGVPAGRHYGIIGYEGDRPSRWGDLDQIVLHGYWTFDWSDSYQRVASIDPGKSEITLAPPHHNYGYTKHQRFRAVNVLAELDRPGEWYVNRATGVLVYWPPDSLREAHPEVSLLEEPLVVLDGAMRLTLQELDFTVSRGSGILMRDGFDNRVAGCAFTNLGDDAVVVEGGTGHQIRSCDITEVARGGIRLSGGDRTTLEPGRNAAVNNHIYRWSRWLRTGNYAVIVDGVGNRVAHNLIHDAPFEAMYLKGNEHLIEYNEIHHVTQETGDAGALHTGRDWTWRGNVIRHNYFHDLKGPGLHGVMGVYLDDWASDFHVYGNVFYRAGRATLIGGGHDNRVENNLYIECSPSIHVDARGLGWAGYYFDGSRPELFTKLESMQFRSPPYGERYPELLSYLEGNPAIPKNNRISGNISGGGRWLDVYDFNAFDLDLVRIDGNVVADSVVLRRRVPGLPGWDPYYLNIDLLDGYDHLTAGDDALPRSLSGNFFQNLPVRFDPRARTIVVTDRRLLERAGFQIPELGKMGLQADEFRDSE